MCWFHVWKTDVRQAYLQSEALLQRNVFLNPTGIVLGKDEVLQLFLPLYGLIEAGEYWKKTLASHVHADVEFEQTPTDSLSSSIDKEPR